MGNSNKNESHYDKAYASSSLMKALIKLHLSYDQLSKTRRNIKILKNNLKSPDCLSVFDYGFGHGTFLYRVPRALKVSGCELSSEAIENVRRLFTLSRREITLFRQEEFLLLSDQQNFDLIYCSHVLEHVENDVELLGVFHKHLQDGGRLLLNVPINEVHKDPKHVREYSSASLQQQLKSAGFTVESTLETDRWTAYILDKEYVSQTLPRPIIRVLRLFLAPLPVSLLDYLETMLPERYRFQQLIIVARKS